MSNDANYFKKIIWSIGLIILINLSYNFKIQLQQTAQMTFNIVPVLWFDVMVSLLMGCYISILLVQKWSLNVNHALLWCVTVPCLVLVFIYPTVSTLITYELLPESSSFSLILSWSLKIAMSSPYVVGIVAGLTFVLSLFSNSRKSKALQ